MRNKAILLASASLALWGCGSDSDSTTGGAQSELAELLIAEEIPGASASCVREKTAELSDDDASFLIDNIDATDTEGFSDELQAWVEGLLDCIDLGSQSDGESDGESDDSAATDESDTVETATTEGSGAAAELASVSKSGFASSSTGSGETWASAGALIVNNTDEDLFSTEVTFNFVGADGTPVATESTYVEVIPAGGSFPATSQTYTDLTAAMPVTLEVAAFAEADSFFESDWVELELGPTTITTDEYFSTVSGTVTNVGDQPFDFYPISCLILTADGTIVGGAFAYPDQVAPGQTIAWDTTVDDGPIEAGGVVAECRSIATIS